MNFWQWLDKNGIGVALLLLAAMTLASATSMIVFGAHAPCVCPPAAEVAK